MEKSIETIWKEGFLESDALVAPQINELYNRKSSHIIDKFKRMFKLNLIAIVVGSILFLPVSFILGMPIMGVAFFCILTVIVIVNKKLLNGLRKIEKNENSYQYLKSFDNWMKEQLLVNTRMSRFYYPLFFLSFIFGLWFSNTGQAIFYKILESPYEIYLVNGIPVFWMLLLVLIAGLLGLIGGQIYKWDVNMIYGRVFRKLEEIITDMEELRN